MNPGLFALKKRGSSFTSAYKNAVLADAPLLYWRLDEITGTVANDTSGNNHTGTYPSDASNWASAGLLTTDNDKGILTTTSFTGVVSAANSPIASNSDWSIECLIRPTAPPPSSGVGVINILNYQQGCPEIDVLDNGSGTFKLRVMRASTAQLFVSAGTYTYGNTYYVVLTYSAATGALILYVNGVADTNSASYIYSSYTGITSLGYDLRNNGYPFLGYMDEFALYQSTLSASRVSAHYNAGI